MFLPSSLLEALNSHRLSLSLSPFQGPAFLNIVWVLLIHLPDSGSSEYIHSYNINRIINANYFWFLFFYHIYSYNVYRIFNVFHDLSWILNQIPRQWFIGFIEACIEYKFKILWSFSFPCSNIYIYIIAFLGVGLFFFTAQQNLNYIGCIKVHRRAEAEGGKTESRGCHGTKLQWWTNSNACGWFL